MRKSLVVYFSLADEQNKKSLAVQGKVAQTNKNTAKKAVQDWLVKIWDINGSWTMNGDNICFLFSRFFAILTKLNANDTCVEVALRVNLITAR